MPFFKVNLRDGLFEAVIVEAADVDEAYDRALGHCPIVFGNAELEEGDVDPSEVVNPLSEAYPILPAAYFGS
jgi:hypothetical protein